MGRSALNALLIELNATAKYNRKYKGSCLGDFTVREPEENYTALQTPKWSTVPDIEEKSAIDLSDMDDMASQLSNLTINEDMDPTTFIYEQKSPEKDNADATMRAQV